MPFVPTPRERSDMDVHRVAGGVDTERGGAGIAPARLRWYVAAGGHGAKRARKLPRGGHQAREGTPAKSGSP
jgi:hypothetical protein